MSVIVVRNLSAGLGPNTKCTVECGGRERAMVHMWISREIYPGHVRHVDTQCNDVLDLA